MLKKKKKKRKTKAFFFSPLGTRIKKYIYIQSIGGLQWPNELVQVFFPY